MTLRPELRHGLQSAETATENPLLSQVAVSPPPTLDWPREASKAFAWGETFALPKEWVT
jgi:hypothetical protein